VAARDERKKEEQPAQPAQEGQEAQTPAVQDSDILDSAPKQQHPSSIEFVPVYAANGAFSGMYKRL
jgi:hypothetical protein